MASGSRFAHLLKPIRDLAENWSVDIASELVDYLEELDEISIEFESGETNLNFAEAALLIQGSAVVYSKKVEFLYSLVYRTLDLLNDNKRKAAAALGGDADDDLLEPAEAAFLPLDDDIKVSTNININRGGREEAGGVDLDRTVGLVERAPFVLAGSGLEHGVSLRMMTCGVHASGAMLLEDNDCRRFDSTLRAFAPALAPAGDVTEAGVGEGSGTAPHDEDMLDDDEGMVCDDGGGYDDWGGAAPDDDFNGDVMVTDKGDSVCMNEVQKKGEEEEEEVMFDPWRKLDPHVASDSKDRLFRRGKTTKVPRALVESASKSVSRLPGTAKNAAALLLGGRGGTLRWLATGSELSAAIRTSSLAAKAPATSTVAYGQLIFPEFRYFQEHERRNVRRAALLRSRSRTTGVPSKRGAALGVSSAGGDGNEDGTLEDDGWVGDDGDGGWDFGEGGGGDSDGEDESNSLTNVNLRDAFEGESGMRRRLDLNSGGMEGVGAEEGAGVTYMDLVRDHVQRYLRAADEWAVESRLSQRVRSWQERITPKLDLEDCRPIFDIHGYGSRILQGLRMHQVNPAAATDGASSASHLPSDSHEDVASFVDLVAPASLNKDGEVSGRDNHEKEFESDSQSGRAAPSSNEYTVEDYRFEVCRLFLASLQLANNGNVDLTHAIVPSVPNAAHTGDGRDETDLVDPLKAEDDPHGASWLTLRLKNSMLMSDNLKDYRAPSTTNRGEADSSAEATATEIGEMEVLEGDEEKNDSEESTKRATKRKSAPNTAASGRPQTKQKKGKKCAAKNLADNDGARPARKRRSAAGSSAGVGGTAADSNTAGSVAAHATKRRAAPLGRHN